MSDLCYLGFDECIGNCSQDPIIIAMAVSRNPEEISQNLRLPKRRDLDQKVLERNFLYTVIEKDSLYHHRNMHATIEELVFAGINKFCNYDDLLELYFDGSLSNFDHERKLLRHPQFKFESVTFVRSGDEKLRLLNIADHIANIVYCYLSNSPISKRRVNAFRLNYSRLDEVLSQSKIVVPMPKTYISQYLQYDRDRTFIPERPLFKRVRSNNKKCTQHKDYA
ncbi:MAG: hypothetical protein AABX08_03490 [Nanoarchaeota archaeon]